MKLTKATLKKIIKEEYGKAVTENEEFRTQQGGDYFAPEGEYDEQQSAKKHGVGVVMSPVKQEEEGVYSVTLTFTDPKDDDPNSKTYGQRMYHDAKDFNESLGEELLVPLLIDRFADVDWMA